MNIRIAKVFLPVELYLIDRAGKTLQRFAITDNLPGLLDILQIVIDSSINGLEDVAILDPARPGMIGNAARIAAHYGLRKRSFDEKLNNVRTWTIPEMEG